MNVYRFPDVYVRAVDGGVWHKAEAKVGTGSPMRSARCGLRSVEQRAGDGYTRWFDTRTITPLAEAPRCAGCFS